MYVDSCTGALTAQITSEFLQYVLNSGGHVLESDGRQVADVIASSEQPDVDRVYEHVRAFLYREVTDPMYFKAARGEIHNDTWLSAVRDVRTTWATPSMDDVRKRALRAI